MGFGKTMGRLAAAVLTGLVMLAGAACAEAPGLSIHAPGEEIRPGRPVVISFTVPEDGVCSIGLTDAENTEALTITEGRNVTAGYNAMYWNGTCGGKPVPEGDWRLVIRMNGKSAETPVSIGRMVPCLISVRSNRTKVMEDGTVQISYCATEKGSLLLREETSETPLFRGDSAAGDGEFTFRAELEPGTRVLLLTLTGEDGTLSEAARLTLEVREKPDPNVISTPGPLTEQLREKGKNGFTPAQTSPRKGEDPTLNYWTLPMDITDEEAVWKVLTAPVTVVDNGKKNAEKLQIIIRSQPSEDSDGVGMVTCISQSVHVLERGEKWSLIECYSSSFHDSAILNWNTLVQGYVPTEYLTEVVPNQEMGLVVDKLTQRLYVFVGGGLFSTLLVSTGKSNAKQPYNETRSGEFLLVSKVGEFSSDNLKCALAMRFNDGDLLHEVPYIQGDGYRNYTVNEPKLGTKASHGCIRVQRQASPEGVSQSWLWNKYKKNTKILIWEDWQGRQIPIPAEDTILFCGKKKTGNYHTTDQCGAILGKQTDTLTYGQLDEKEYRRLNPCPLCAAPARHEEIEEINRRYAAGGDHDPVMTEARRKCPRKQKEK